MQGMFGSLAGGQGGANPFAGAPGKEGQAGDPFSNLFQQMGLDPNAAGAPGAANNAGGAD